ncbi:MAG: RIP metalloprotease [Maricaulaceae bacterium]|nr:RIP metalloprotease [Maricaulaceae bacterium]
MLDALGGGLLTIFAFLFVISIVVVIHELGHYFAGRAFGVHAEAFSFGFGPTLFAARDRRGTIWRVAAFPLGGYVRFMGDAGAASEPDREKLAQMRRDMGADAGRCFHFKPLWQRAIIVIAGPVANFILAISLFAALAMAFGVRGYAPVVGAVVENSAAAEAGFQPGDRIIAIDGRAARDFEHISTEVFWRAGHRLSFEVERDGRTLTLEATPRSERVQDAFGGYREIARLGLHSTSEVEHRRFGLGSALAHGVERSWRMIVTTGRYVGAIVTGRAPPNLLNGPVGIVTVSGQVAQSSLEGAPDAGIGLLTLLANLLQLAAFVSVALGLVNLLPIPMLDGGHLMYYAYEAVARRPLSARVQVIGFRVGLALVLGMMLVATWNDLHYLRGLFS